MPPPHPLHGQIASALLAKHALHVSPDWLSDFLAMRGTNLPPLNALVSTAHFRILASDITSSLQPVPLHLLPQGVDDVNVKEQRLDADVVVQVLDVLDVGVSKWSQVEAIERVERGEEVRGREVIRTVGNADDDLNNEAGQAGGTNGSTAATGGGGQQGKTLSHGPHRLLVQDARGTKVSAFELSKVPKIGISTAACAVVPGSLQNLTPASTLSEDPGMFIGCKLHLRAGTVVRRGMLMLRPEQCTVLGGKVEAWDKKWKEERKARLQRLIAEEHAEANVNAETEG